MKPVTIIQSNRYVVNGITVIFRGEKITFAGDKPLQEKDTIPVMRYLYAEGVVEEELRKLDNHSKYGFICPNCDTWNFHSEHVTYEFLAPTCKSCGNRID